MKNISEEMAPLERIGRNRYFGEIDGKKIGVALATKNPAFDEAAVNKSDLDRVITAKRDGRLDEAKVVAAKMNGGGVPTFYDQIDAELLQEKLAGVPPRSGRYGEFYTIPSSVGFPDDESEPF